MQIVSHLKSRATRELRARGIDPMQQFRDPDGSIPSPWGGGLWKVYINNPEHYQAAIRYVENNPAKEGKEQQRWSFVVPWEVSHPDAPRKRDG